MTQFHRKGSKKKVYARFYPFLVAVYLKKTRHTHTYTHTQIVNITLERLERIYIQSFTSSSRDRKDFLRQPTWETFAIGSEHPSSDGPLGSMITWAVVCLSLAVDTQVSFTLDELSYASRAQFYRFSSSIIHFKFSFNMPTSRATSMIIAREWDEDKVLLKAV